MGRPGPMGQSGGKGEKVSCFATSAPFFIMSAFFLFIPNKWL